MSEEKQMNIYQRVHAVMQKVHGVKKLEQNPHAKYRYAGHEAVTAALRTAYVECGIVRHASVESCVRGEEKGLVRLEVLVNFVNVDSPGDRICLTIFAEAPSTTSAKSATPQQTGVALSYAVKNAEFKLFALTGDDTPDADSYGTAPVPSVDFEGIAEELAASKDTEALTKAVARVRAAVPSLTEDQRGVLRNIYADIKQRLTGRALSPEKVES